MGRDRYIVATGSIVFLAVVGGWGLMVRAPQPTPDLRDPSPAQSDPRSWSPLEATAVLEPSSLAERAQNRPRPGAPRSSSSMPVHRFAVEVVDWLTGLPLSGIELAIIEDRQADEALEPPIRVVSDRAGLAAFDTEGVDTIRTPDPRWMVRDYEGPEPSFEWDRPIEPFRVALQPAGQVEGRVVTRVGEPIAGAEISVTSAALMFGGPDWLLEDGPQITTDHDGRYVLGKLTVGEQIDLAVRVPEHVPARRLGVVVLEGPRTTVPDIVVEEGIPMRLRVAMKGGDALAAAEALVWEDERTVPLGEVAMVELGGAVDSEGFFAPGRVPNRPLRVQASAEGHVSEAMTWRPTPEVVTIALKSASTLQARLTSSTGEPLAGVRVMARTPAREPVAWTRSDVRGELELRGPPGLWDLSVYDRVIAEAIPSDTTGLELVLPVGTAELQFVGAATERTDRGSAGSRSFRLASEDWEWDYRSSVSLGGSTFDLENVPAGRYRITVDGTGLVEVMDVRDRQVTRVEIQLPPPEIALRGRVVNRSSGLGVSLADVTARPAQGTRTFPTRTDEQGDFRLSLPDRGRWEVRAERAGYESAVELLELNETVTETELSLEPVAGPSIVGRVSRDGDPVAGASVSVFPASGRTDRQGRFVLTGLPLGERELVVTVGERRVHRRPVSLHGLDEQVVDVDLAAGFRVEGLVRTGERPLPFAPVTIEALDEKGRASEAVEEVFADPDGRFEISGLWPGPHILGAELPGGDWDVLAWQRVDGAAGDVVRVDLVLGAASLEVVVEGAGGVSTRVIVRPADLESGVEMDELVEDGTAHFASVPPGEVVIDIDPDGDSHLRKQRLRFQVREGANRLVVELKAGARLAFDVLTPGRGRASGRAFLSSGGDVLEVTSWEVVSPGSYDALVGRAGLGARLLHDLELEAGEERRLAVSLSGLAVLTIESDGMGRPKVRLMRGGFDHAVFGSFPHYPLEPGRYLLEVDASSESWTRRIDMGASDQAVRMK